MSDDRNMNIGKGWLMLGVVQLLRLAMGRRSSMGLRLWMMPLEVMLSMGVRRWRFPWTYLLLRMQ
jgi:hypothetical protein